MNIGKIVLVKGTEVVTGFAVAKAISTVIRKVNPNLVKEPEEQASVQDVLIYLWVAIMIAVIATGSAEFVSGKVSDKFYPEIES